MKNIIKHNIKHNIWLTGCVTLLFILCRPMMQLMAYENEKIYAMSPQELVQKMEKFFLPDIFTDYIPTVIACVVIAIVFFNYLFSKKRVDLYHSIPINRNHLFIANYVSGVIVYIFALLLEYVICVFIALPNHYMTATSFKYMIAAIAINLVHFLFGYGIVITAVMLSGNPVVAIAESAAISLIYPVAVSLFQNFKRYFYVTYDVCTEIKPEPIVKFYWLSPFTSYASIIQRAKYEWDTYYYKTISQAYADLILPVVMVIIFTAFAFFLYMKRPSEAAGRTMAFKKTRAFIEVPCTIVCGMIGGWFMSTSVNTYKTVWIWIGVIIGVILSHFILEAILNESFKAIISHKLQLAVTLAVIVAFFGVLFTDATHYDSYIPKADSVASATVYFTDIDGNMSAQEFIKNEGSTEYYTVKYLDRQTYMYTHRFTDSEMIEKIVDISKIGTSYVQDMIQRKNDNTDGIYYKEDTYAVDDVILGEGDSKELGISEDEAYSQAKKWMDENGITELEHSNENDIMGVNVCYELKNGKIVLRHYEIPVSNLFSSIDAVYCSDEYKKENYNLFRGYEEGNISKVEIYDNFENKTVSLTGAEKDRILKTYMKELSKINVDMLCQVPVGRISPLVKITDIYSESYSGYYIYPEFTETLALIESYGADISGFTKEVKAEDITSINVSSYNLYGYDKDKTLSADNIVYDQEKDSEFIKELAPNLINANNIWSNYMLIRQRSNYDNLGIDTTVNLVPLKGFARTFSIIYKDGKAPERIKKDVAIKIWQENSN